MVLYIYIKNQVIIFDLPTSFSIYFNRSDVEKNTVVTV